MIPRFLPRGSFSVLPFLTIVATCSAGWIDRVHGSAAGTAKWTENISRTSYEPTRKDAASYELGLSAGVNQGLARNLTGDAFLQADAVIVPDFTRTNTTTVGPKFGLQYKFGLGPLAPSLRVESGYSYSAARIRSNRGGSAEAAVRFSQRVTSNLRFGVSGEWLEHYARSSTFDIQQRTVSFQAAWDLDDRWTLSGSTSRLTGRIVANAAPSIWSQAISGGLGATVFDYYTTIPAEVTNSYGPGWVAYNLEAHADSWTVALAARLGSHTSVELRTTGVMVENKIGVRYPTKTWGLGVSHRF